MAHSYLHMWTPDNIAHWSLHVASCMYTRQRGHAGCTALCVVWSSLTRLLSALGPLPHIHAIGISYQYRSSNVDTLHSPYFLTRHGLSPASPVPPCVPNTANSACNPRTNVQPEARLRLPAQNRTASCAPTRCGCLGRAGAIPWVLVQGASASFMLHTRSVLPKEMREDAGALR